VSVGHQDLVRIEAQDVLASRVFESPQEAD
jgi:hypothetical protein